MSETTPELIQYMSLPEDVVDKSLSIINFYQEAVHDFKLNILGWQTSRNRIEECVQKNLPLEKKIIDDLKNFHRQINWYVSNIEKERNDNNLDYN